jgi:hypothetical protein
MMVEVRKYQGLGNGMEMILFGLQSCKLFYSFKSLINVFTSDAPEIINKENKEEKKIPKYVLFQPETKQHREKKSDAHKRTHSSHLDFRGFLLITTNHCYSPKEFSGVK